jgi:hypothetical protein
MRRFAICAFLALCLALPAAAKSKAAPAKNKASVSARLGAEAAFENNFTRIGVGPWFDISASSGLLDVEAYLGWTPYVEAPSLGSLFGEFDLYYHILFKNRVSLNPALCVSDYIWLENGANTVMIEPSLKLDISNFFAKLCVPVQLSPDTALFAYLEPGIHIDRLTLKMRGAVELERFNLDYLRWWADIAFGKNDLYAYGVVRGLDAGQEIGYNQYVGFYFGL